MGIAPIFLRAGSMPHIVGNLSTRATTFLETSLPLEVYAQNYGPPKSQKSQLWKFWDSHLGVSWQNDIWVLVPWPGIEYTIRGKVVASLKFGLWWILWIHVCLWFIRAPKCSNYTIINLLFGLCRFVWVIKLLVNLLTPILELQHAILPPKCCMPRSVPQLFLLLLFTFRFTVQPIKELWGALMIKNGHQIGVLIDVTFRTNEKKMIHYIWYIIYSHVLYYTIIYVI